jgi:hypothetical protein
MEKVAGYLSSGNEILARNVFHISAYVISFVFRHSRIVLSFILSINLTPCFLFSVLLSNLLYI